MQQKIPSVTKCNAEKSEWRKEKTSTGRKKFLIKNTRKWINPNVEEH